MISSIGSSFSFIAIMFLAISFTQGQSTGKAAQAIALLLIAQVIPSLVLGSVAGTIVDRYDRKLIMVLADLFGSIIAFGIVFATSIQHLYLAASLSIITRLFFYPADSASLPRIVDATELLKANGVKQTIVRIAALSGPVLAGLIIYSFGLKIAFIVDGISFLVSGLSLIFIKTDLKPQRTEIKKMSIITDLKEGFMLMLQDNIIRYLFILLFFLFAATALINSLLVFYFEHWFGINEQDFGFLTSVAAISAISTSVLISKKGSIKRKLSMITLSTFLIAVALLLLAIAGLLRSNGIYLLYLAMIIIGANNIIIQVPFASLFQVIVDDQNLGKLGGFLTTYFSVSRLIGGLIASSFVIIFSIVQVLIATSIFCIFLGVGAFFYMAYSHLEYHSQERERHQIMRREEKRGETAKRKAIPS